MDYLSKIHSGRGGILCFEPNPISFSYLKNHLAINKLKKIYLANLAVGDVEQQIKFYLNDKDDTSVFASEMKLTDDGASFSSLKVKLDDIFFGEELTKSQDLNKSQLRKSVSDLQLNINVGFIKIDVEGYEFEVVEGAHELIKTHKPDLCFEINLLNWSFRNRTIGEFFEFLNSINYVIYAEAGEGLEKITNYKFNNRVFNVHAFHKSREELIKDRFK
jgi:FkbM family methyltransferase